MGGWEGGYIFVKSLDSRQAGGQAGRRPSRQAGKSEKIINILVFRKKCAY